MSQVTRRFIVAGSLCGALSTMARAANAAAPDYDSALVEDWLQRWIDSVRPPVGTLHLSRFVERVWFLTKPIGWDPSPERVPRVGCVAVPMGFITDFASIPRVFWTLLPPDGDYTYAAIIHDYLYWTQDLSRETADEIFHAVMQEFRVNSAAARTIYSAVRVAGGWAWDANGKAKANREKRVLKVLPTDPRTRWDEWKKQEGVFEQGDQPRPHC